MWTLNPLSDIQCSTEKSRSFISRTIDTSNFVTTWVVCGFLIYESFVYFSAIDLKQVFEMDFLSSFSCNSFWFYPGCGPQILVTTFYLNGFIPFSAELGNAISNDGDALFPCYCPCPKSSNNCYIVQWNTCNDCCV